MIYTRVLMQIIMYKYTMCNKIYLMIKVNNVENCYCTVKIWFIGRKFTETQNIPRVFDINKSIIDMIVTTINITKKN